MSGMSSLAKVNPSHLFDIVWLVQCNVYNKFQSYAFGVDPSVARHWCSGVPLGNLLSPPLSPQAVVPGAHRKRKPLILLNYWGQLVVASIFKFHNWIYDSLFQEGDNFGDHHHICNGFFTDICKFSPLFQLLYKLGKGFRWFIRPYHLDQIFFQVNLVNCPVVPEETIICIQGHECSKPCQ